MTILQNILFNKIDVLIYNDPFLVAIIPLNYSVSLDNSEYFFYFALKLEYDKWETLMLQNNHNIFRNHCYTTTITIEDFIEILKSQYQFIVKSECPLCNICSSFENALSHVFNRKLLEISNNSFYIRKLTLIQNWWCDNCYYNPLHYVCKKRLYKDYKDLIKTHFLNKTH